MSEPPGVYLRTYGEGLVVAGGVPHGELMTLGAAAVVVVGVVLIVVLLRQRRRVWVLAPVELFGPEVLAWLQQRIGSGAGH